MKPPRLDRRTNLLAAFVILANVIGNSFLSWGMKHQTLRLGLSPFVYIQVIFTPWVACGTTLLVFWLLSRMALLGWADLSYVLPVTSVGYVLTAILGRYIFNEQITWQRWLGILLIVTGFTVVGLTLPNTTAAQRGPEEQIR